MSIGSTAKGPLYEVLSPLVASILAKGGYSKKEIQQYLFERVRIPARQFDRILKRFWPSETACTLVKSGKLPTSYCETDDPERAVPLMWGPDEVMIIVAGDPDRNRSRIALQCADQGLATSKEVNLSANWGKSTGAVMKSGECFPVLSA